jgi:Uma2 family endonuclease
LQDLPYKIETNRRGQIIMTPTFQSHGARQIEIGGRLREKEGRAVSECAIRTSDGTKVADVGWYTTERWNEVSETFDTPTAPQVCVEILSPTNTEDEMLDKKALYFEAGAEEVWLCDTEGRMRFFDADGEREASARAPGFPHEVEI